MICNFLNFFSLLWAVLMEIIWLIAIDRGQNLVLLQFFIIFQFDLYWSQRLWSIFWEVRKHKIIRLSSKFLFAITFAIISLSLRCIKHIHFWIICFKKVIFYYWKLWKKQFSKNYMYKLTNKIIRQGWSDFWSRSKIIKKAKSSNMKKGQIKAKFSSKVC